MLKPSRMEELLSAARVTACQASQSMPHPIEQCRDRMDNTEFQRPHRQRPNPLTSTTGKDKLEIPKRLSAPFIYAKTRFLGHKRRRSATKFSNIEEKKEEEAEEQEEEEQGGQPPTTVFSKNSSRCALQVPPSTPKWRAKYMMSLKFDAPPSPTELHQKKKHQKTHYNERGADDSTDEKQGPQTDNRQNSSADKDSSELGGVYFGELRWDNNHFGQKVPRRRTHSAPMPHEVGLFDLHVDIGLPAAVPTLKECSPSTSISSTPSTISESSLDHPLTAESATDWGWFVDSNGSNGTSGDLKASIRVLESESLHAAQQAQKEQEADSQEADSQEADSQESSASKQQESPALALTKVMSRMSRMSFLDLAALGKGDLSSALKRQDSGGRLRSKSMQPGAFSHTF